MSRFLSYGTSFMLLCHISVVLVFSLFVCLFAVLIPIDLFGIELNLIYLAMLSASGTVLGTWSQHTFGELTSFNMHSRNTEALLLLIADDNLKISGTVAILFHSPGLLVPFFFIFFLLFVILF